MKNLKKIVLFLFSVIILNTLFSFTPTKKVSEKKWHGIASFYHHKFSGRKTSTGETFSNQKYTAANNFLPLGSIVKITNIKNGKSVIVKINDRMNKNNKRLIDLSQIAAKELAIINQGIAQVAMELLDSEDFFASK